MRERLKSYLDLYLHDVIYQNQYGSWKNRSTQDALIDIVKIQHDMDNKFFFCGISRFVDLKKAFITVDHSSLLRKLEHYDILKGKYHGVFDLKKKMVK